MKYDGTLDLAVGLSAKSKNWKNVKWSWSDLVGRLGEEHKTLETHKEFISASKEEQLKIKDVGGFVGGYLKGGRRKPENVVHRQLLTLDIDFAHLNFWDDFTLSFPNAAVLHGTHKHSPSNPRYRLIMPLSRSASPDEYVAVARRVSGMMGIELFDNTTFETNRLMFWPSTPRDQEYFFRVQDGPWVNVDEILDTYADWTDSSCWPTAESKIDEIKAKSRKQEDPEQKKGLIGAFCRSYTISESIEKFLPEVYTPAMDDRYTYLKGSAAAGLMTYDDKFAYSHHGTDPCSGKLCNSFDLVRIHLFGHLDVGGNNEKSTKAMEDFSRQDPKVKNTIASETILETKYDFAGEVEEVQDLSWTKDLELDFHGKYISSAYNLNLILSKDENLCGLFRQNLFDSKRYIFGSTPWRKIVVPEPIKNVDYSGVRNYIETVYGIIGNLKIDDVLALEFEKKSFHPVLEYLSGLTWDGGPRVETLLIDYFGAEDSHYTRQCIKKALVGAVSRIFHPGIKFDLVLTLVGEQGTGKSTLVKKLGKTWFSDTFLTVNGKDAFEQLQGAWIIELAELAGLRKAEVETIKHFISKQEDIFRPAYARAPETFKRQCIFIGTTNNKDFLRDPSGNRRFMPVDIDPSQATKDIFTISENEVDQIWAEAVQLFQAGENLYLDKEAESLALMEQRKHYETDERKGIVENYLNTLLPKNWDELDLFERRMFLNENSGGSAERDFVCVAEIWCECLGKEKEIMDRYKTREINDILRGMEGWEQSKSTKNFKLYGKQKYYVRKLD